MSWHYCKNCFYSYCTGIYNYSYSHLLIYLNFSFIFLLFFRPNGGQDQEGTALPYVARTKKQPPQKSNQSDGLGGSRCNSNNSIFNQDPGSASSSQKKNTDRCTVRTGKENDKSVYGMDNEFLKKICSWRPKAFGSPRTEGHNTSDKSDPSAFQNGDSHSDISKINGEGKSPFLRRLNSSNLLISEGGIPSFEQFRKASGALWERAQDFIPSEKNEIEGEGRNRKEKEKENYDEIKIQKIENSNGEEKVSFEGREKSRSCEADVRNNNTHSFDSYCDINNINKNSKNGKNDIDYENRSIYSNIVIVIIFRAKLVNNFYIIINTTIFVIYIIFTIFTIFINIINITIRIKTVCIILFYRLLDSQIYSMAYR